MKWRMRVARPTDNLDQIVAMYRDGLGMTTLGSFEDHEGFDGVILGRENLEYEIEFTRHDGSIAGRAPTKDNLLVFYIPDPESWSVQCDQMIESGFVVVTSFNPYWDRAGKTFEDVDGYRVVLQCAR